MTDLSWMIDCAWKPPRRPPRSKTPAFRKTLPENLKYYKYWGFTIYRTYYGPSSDEHWETLLCAIKQQTRLAFGYYETESFRKKDRAWQTRRYVSDADYDRDLRIIKDLFRLFPREDPSLLLGLSIEGIREICMQEHSEAEEKMAGADFNFVLVADEAVLNGIAQGKFAVKAVGYDWDKLDGGWGWERVSTGSLLEFWGMLLESRESGIGKYYTFRYEGPEEGLESYLWGGNPSAPRFERCSQAQIARRVVRTERATSDFDWDSLLRPHPPRPHHSSTPL
jgi:DNA-binding transcriptional MerR regulator